ncbi:MAG: Stp1/IreP family PP2C-type Ser/Thr phosphatase [Sandaracinaceae bacterium]|nr:Stp1/IreP family PP2C-type Ser/Thr phosphatase [Sandaracinaceae bacterium]
MAPTDGFPFWPVTDVGRVRNVNEDSFLVDKKLNLFVVCDGMGGHAAGEVASQLAARYFREAVVASREMIDDFERGTGSVKREDILQMLQRAVQEACEKVHAEGQNDDTKRGMGTTLTALLVVGSRGFLAHVGDSRLYLVREGQVHHFVEDHSLINELLKRGRLTKEQIDKVQYKNAVTRAVGVYESVEADTLDFDVLGGDRYLLCSDGMHGYFKTGELAQYFVAAPDETIAQTLVDLSNDRGGKDNITVLLVRIPDADAGVDMLAREVNLKIDALAKMPFFRFLAYQELVRVLNMTEVRTYQIGDEIVKQGQEGDELFIVLTGQVRVHTGDAIITRLGAGQHFGEMAMVDKAPRSASVSADDPTKLLVIRRRDFYEIIRKDPPVAVKLLWSFVGVLTERLRNTSRELGEAREQAALEDITDEIFPIEVP